LAKIQNENIEKVKLAEKENKPTSVESSTKEEAIVENVNINDDDEDESLNDEEDDYDSADDDEFVEDNEDDNESDSSGIISDTEITEVIKNIKDDKKLKRPLDKKCNEENRIIKKKDEYFNPDFKTNYKPRINTNSKVMVIKQIALDELSGDDDEIKISNNKDEEIINHNEPVKQTSSDPFFLPSNGVIQPVDTSNARIDNSIRDKYDDYDDDDGRNKRFKNSKYLDSTFTNLNSSRDYNNRNSSYSQNRNENSYNNRDNGFNRQNRFDNSRSYQDKSSTNGFNIQNRNENSYNSRNNGFNTQNRFDNSRSIQDKSTSNGFKRQDKNNEYYQEKPKSVEDESNLHPSWKAKKEQEEKLKSLKFQGTKVKFDD
jgi:hypothetical protein